MEASVLYTIAALRKVSSLAVLAVSDYLYTGQFERIGDEELTPERRPDDRGRGSRGGDVMNREVTPPSIAPPAAAYAHAVVSEATTKMLHTAGVVPIAPDGSVPEGLADQAQVVWHNIEAILAAAGFVISDIVSMTTYVVAGANLALVMSAHETRCSKRTSRRVDARVCAGARPATVADGGGGRRRSLNALHHRP